jgi:hypothetical protein
MEYKLSSAVDWTACTAGSVTGLAAGAYAVRIKATGSAFKSAETSITVNAFSAAQESTPAAAINYTTEKLTGLTASASYTVNGNAKTADASGTISIDSGWLGTTVSIKKTGNSTTTIDSTAQSVPIPSRPGAPTGVAGGLEKITGTTALMEYKPASGGSWADCSVTETAVAAGGYVVRLKATGSAFASAPTGTLTVTVIPPSVSLVEVSPSTASVNQGRSETFSATVTAAGGASQAVTWSIVGSHKAGTSIAADGKLTIAIDEDAATLTVKATSVFDNTKAGTAAATVLPGKDLLTSFKLKKSENLVPLVGSSDIVGNITGQTFVVLVPYGSDIPNLTETITVSANATFTILKGNPFGEPYPYERIWSVFVNAGDGSSESAGRQYDITIREAANVTVEDGYNHGDDISLVLNGTTVEFKRGSGAVIAAVGGGTDYQNVVWKVDNVVTGNATSASVDLSPAMYEAGQHVVSLDLTINGLPYHAEGVFTK